MILISLLSLARKTKPLPSILILVTLTLPANLNASNLPDIGSKADTVLSREDEKALGKEFMRSVRRALKLMDDPLSNEYIQTLGEQLISTIDASGTELSLFIVQNDAINAFAGPGGYIGMHSGLIAATESEGELASVVAHEIAHVLQRHLVRSFESSQNLSLAAMAAIFAAIMLGGGNGQVGEAVIASTIAGSTQQQLSFSRAHEQEADRVGIEMLASAGFDPNTMADFFEILHQQNRFSSHSIPEFLLTHPVTGNRIADSRGRAAQYHQDRKTSSGYSRDPVQYELIRSRVKILAAANSSTAQESQMIDAQTTSSPAKKLAARYENALIAMRNGDQKTAQAILQSLITQDKNRLPYVISLSESLVESGDINASLQTLAKALMIYPNNTPLTMLYAQTLLRADKAINAMQVIQTHQRQRFAPIQMYKLLAQAAQKAGYLSEAYESLANFYYEQAEMQTALDHYKQALKQADIDAYRELRIKARIDELTKQLANKRPDPVRPGNSFDKPL